MSDNHLFFNDDPPGAASSRPKDDFSPPKSVSDTIYYLTIAVPHANSWTYHGPVSTSTSLIPLVEKAISPSRSAVRKWRRLVRETEEADQLDDWVDDGWGNFVLKDKGPAFKERGFNTFVMQHELDGIVIQREYTVFRIVREANGEVLPLLPGPVFTVSSHGPMYHDMGTSVHTTHSGRPKGLATTSEIIGSYTTAAGAKMAAHRVMDHLLKDHPEVQRIENWEMHDQEKKRGSTGKRKDAGRGLLLAMDAERTWEVKIEYEADVLGGAVERYDGEERNMASGKKATWRV